jgi:hypothetical protein
MTALRPYIAGLLLTSLFPAACAEIVKTAVPTDHGLDLYWWPKVAIPKGWVHDETRSQETSSNVLTPKGQTFAGAPAIIYCRAFYEPNKKKRGTLEAYIKGDIAQTKEEKQRVVVKELAPIKTADGRILRVYSFYDPRVSYDQIAYGREGAYTLLFAMSAKTESDLKANQAAFQTMLAKYR